MSSATGSRWELKQGVALCLAALLSACALKSLPPQAELLREAYANTSIPAAWTAPGGRGGRVGDDWLLGFDDAQLARLIDEAMTHNADLRAAAARVEQAAAYVKVAGGQIQPAVNLFGRSSVKDATGFRGVFITASWEIDVWGRLRYGLRAVEDQHASARADHAHARQSLAAVVAKASFLATEAKLQRELAAEALVAAERLVGFAEDRWRVGAGNELDVMLGRANVQTLRDGARQMDLAQDQSLRALELLLGRYPAAEIAAAPRLAPMPGPVPVGLPSELLERRPDVLAAERRVAAAFHRTEESRAAMLPRISLTAGLNHISSDVVVLKQRDNPAWSAGATLTAPLYAGGSLRAQVEVRTAEQKQATAAYAQTGLQAFGEVESALATEFALQERQVILDQSARDNQRVLDLEQTRYRVGARDLRSVTQQQLALYSVRMTLLRVQTEQRVQRVNLHLALGGNFTDPAATALAGTQGRVAATIVKE